MHPDRCVCTFSSTHLLHDLTECLLASILNPALLNTAEGRHCRHPASVYGWDHSECRADEESKAMSLRGGVVSQPPASHHFQEGRSSAFPHLSLLLCRLLHVHRGIPAPGNRRQSPAHQPPLQHYCQVLLCLLLLPHVREAHW